MTETATSPPLARLVRVELTGDAHAFLSPLIEADRAQAVADLAAENSFAPAVGPGPAEPGPFVLHLSIQNGRLLFDIHMKAVEEGREQRIQAIDMGRRGLHDEGATLMMQRLQGKISIDFETARRLFT